MDEVLMPQPTFDDYLRAVQEQRDNAINTVVNLAAEVAALKRELHRLGQEAASSSEKDKSKKP